MSMNQDALLALARALSGKGNVSSADIKNLLSPETGMLTDTFYGSGEDADDEEFMYLKYAPNFRATLNLADDDIRKIISNELANGSTPWDVRRQIEEYTAAQAQMSPGVVNQEGETRDLLSFADKVYGEINSLQIARQEKGRKASADDPFAAGGVPDRNMDFAPEQLAPELFDMLFKRNEGLAADTTKYAARGKARGQALKFLSAQQFDNPLTAKLPIINSGTYLDFAQGEDKVAERSQSKEISRLQKQYQDAEAAAERIRSGKYTELSGGSMSREQALTAAERRVAATRPLFEQAFARGQANDLYSTENKSFGKSQSKDGSFDRAEDARFGRTAQGIVDRSENVTKDVQDTAKKSKYMKEYTEALGMLLQQAARAQGYTPYEETITARSNFLRSGGM